MKYLKNKPHLLLSEFLVKLTFLNFFLLNQILFYSYFSIKNILYYYLASVHLIPFFPNLQRIPTSGVFRKKKISFYSSQHLFFYRKQFFLRKKLVKSYSFISNLFKGLSKKRSYLKQPSYALHTHFSGYKPLLNHPQLPLFTPFYKTSTKHNSIFILNKPEFFLKNRTFIKRRVQLFRDKVFREHYHLILNTHTTILGQLLWQSFLTNTHDSNRDVCPDDDLYQIFRKFIWSKTLWSPEDMAIFSTKRKVFSKVKQLSFLNNNLKLQQTKPLNHPFAKSIVKLYYRRYKLLPLSNSRYAKKFKYNLGLQTLNPRFVKQQGTPSNSFYAPFFFRKTIKTLFRIKWLHTPFFKKTRRCLRVAMSDFRITTRKHHRSNYRRLFKVFFAERLKRYKTTTLSKKRRFFLKNPSLVLRRLRKKKNLYVD